MLTFRTMHKWDSSLSVETVLRSVLNLMLEGRAEIDIYNRYPNLQSVGGTRRLQTYASGSQLELGLCEDCVDCVRWGIM